jgi:hypothetical protein
VTGPQERLTWSKADASRQEAAESAESATEIVSVSLIKAPEVRYRRSRVGKDLGLFGNLALFLGLGGCVGALVDAEDVDPEVSERLDVAEEMFQMGQSIHRLAEKR